jgi:uncharacterized coiled-coil protein SlyX
MTTIPLDLATWVNEPGTVNAGAWRGIQERSIPLSPAPGTKLAEWAETHPIGDEAELRKMADDVATFGVGYAMVTADGVRCLQPMDVIDHDPLTWEQTLRTASDEMLQVAANRIAELESELQAQRQTISDMNEIISYYKADNATLRAPLARRVNPIEPLSTLAEWVIEMEAALSAPSMPPATLTSTKPPLPAQAMRSPHHAPGLRATIA